MRKTVFIIYLIGQVGYGQITILDKTTNYPVSYATISFGNGNGIFANDDGQFIFTKKLYPDIDSLYISALGFKNLKVATQQLSKKLFLNAFIDELEEVVINSNLKRKFKKEILKPFLDDNYYNCWLPTIESEIAVFFPKVKKNDQKLLSVLFPIALESKDWKKRKRSNSEKKKFLYPI